LGRFPGIFWGRVRQKYAWSLYQNQRLLGGRGAVLECWASRRDAMGPTRCSTGSSTGSSNIGKASAATPMEHVYAQACCEHVASTHARALCAHGQPTPSPMLGQAIFSFYLISLPLATPCCQVNSSACRSNSNCVAKTQAQLHHETILIGTIKHYRLGIIKLTDWHNQTFKTGITEHYRLA